MTSAIAPRATRACASSVTMGSLCTFPEVITNMGSASEPRSARRASAKSCSSRCCTGVHGSMTPSSGSLSARPGARCVSGRLRRSTMGRFVDSSCSCSTLSTRQTRRASSAEAIMTANALPWRRLRSRSLASASGFSASHTKWKPPSPLTATMPPAMSTRTAAAKMASDASRVLPQAIDQAGSSGQEANESASGNASGWPGCASDRTSESPGHAPNVSEGVRGASDCPAAAPSVLWYAPCAAQGAR